MLDSPSGLDVCDWPENQTGLRDKSRRHAEANSERDPAPGFLRHDVASAGLLRCYALQPERVHHSLDAAGFVKKSHRAKP